MNSLGAVILAALAIVVLFAPRRWALLGMIAGVLFLPTGQVTGQTFDVLGVHLYPMRCLESLAFVRVIVRKEFSISKVNGVDRSLVLVYAYTTIVFLLRTALDGGTSRSITQVSTASKIALMVDAGLCYFAFRGLTARIGDFVWFLRGLVLLLGPYVALVSIERVTGENPFASMGGTPNLWDEGNGGRIRCMGSFGHPSLLGTLGASFLPLYIALALTKRDRGRALAGIGLCLSIVLLANSGGPVTFVGVGMAAWMLWTMRRRMRAVRWAIVGTLASLALVMNAPLWYLPHRLSSIVGGDGWHRSYLMSQAIEHIDQWWIAGMALDHTTDWFPYLIMGAVDITNAYLSLGFDAGILAIGLFIVLLIRAFRGLGQGLTEARRRSQVAGRAEVLLWGLGAVLTGHLVNLWGITYWDQIYAVWLMQLAAVSSISRAAAEASFAREMLPVWVEGAALSGTTRNA